MSEPAGSVSIPLEPPHWRDDTARGTLTTFTVVALLSLSRKLTTRVAVTMV